MCIRDSVQTTQSYIEGQKIISGLAPNGSAALERIYKTNMIQIASGSHCSIFVTDSEGMLVLVTTEDGSYMQIGGQIPKDIVSGVKQSGTVQQKTNLGGYL